MIFITLMKGSEKYKGFFADESKWVDVEYFEYSGDTFKRVEYNDAMMYQLIPVHKFEILS